MKQPLLCCFFSHSTTSMPIGLMVENMSLISSGIAQSSTSTSSHIVIHFVISFSVQRTLRMLVNRLHSSHFNVHLCSRLSLRLFISRLLSWTLELFLSCVHIHSFKSAESDNGIARPIPSVSLSACLCFIHRYCVTKAKHVGRNYYLTPDSPYHSSFLVSKRRYEIPTGSPAILAL